MIGKKLVITRAKPEVIQSKETLYKVDCFALKMLVMTIICREAMT